MAKRFRFRFETMLKIRRQREDQHKRIVADRLRQITTVRAELRQLDQLIHEENDALRSGQAVGRIDLQQTVRRRQWVMHLHKATLDAEARLRGLEAQLAQERAALAEAAKQRRIIEKLRERQFERHQAEQQRSETVAADDLTTVRYVYEAGAAER